MLLCHEILSSHRKLVLMLNALAIFKRFWVGAFILCTTNAYCDNLSSIQQSRYMRYSFCMERAFGQGWWDKYGVRLQLNRWGVSHPTANSMVKAPERVQKEDAHCRAENEITESSPVGPGMAQGR